MNIKAQIINIPISATTDFAKNSVGNLAEVEIHSVYNKTINLLINKSIFSLHPQNSYLTPVSFVTDFTLQQFQQVPLFPQQTYLLNFDYQHCAIFSAKLTACKNVQIDKLHFYTTLSRQILLQANTLGLRLLLAHSSIEDMILTATQRYLTQAKAFYQAKEYENAAQSLTKLIGLGIGLTPSGDDFLCGLLATFQYFNQTETPFYLKLAEQIRQHLTHTNIISSRFLECALTQQFSSAVLHFFQLPDGQAAEIKKISEAFERIGHSSGMDTLFGIYYGCELLGK